MESDAEKVKRLEREKRHLEIEVACHKIVHENLTRQLAEKQKENGKTSTIPK